MDCRRRWWRGFADELTMQGSRVRIIDEGVAPAVMNSERGLASFSNRKALLYLSDCRRSDER